MAGDARRGRLKRLTGLSPAQSPEIAATRSVRDDEDVLRGLVLRPATADDTAFLQEMLYQAANRPGEVWPPFGECLHDPRNLRFWVDWPRSGDLGVIAEIVGAPIAPPGFAYSVKKNGSRLMTNPVSQNSRSPSSKVTEVGEWETA